MNGVVDCGGVSRSLSLARSFDPSDTLFAVNERCVNDAAQCKANCRINRCLVDQVSVVFNESTDS